MSCRHPYGFHGWRQLLMFSCKHCPGVRFSVMKCKLCGSDLIRDSDIKRAFGMLEVALGRRASYPVTILELRDSDQFKKPWGVEPPKTNGH